MFVILDNESKPYAHYSKHTCNKHKTDGLHLPSSHNNCYSAALYCIVILCLWACMHEWICNYAQYIDQFEH